MCLNYDPSDDFEHVIEELGEEPTIKNEKGKDEIPSNEIRFVLINLIKVMKKLRISMSKHLTILLLFLMLPNLLTPLLKDTTSDVITEETFHQKMSIFTKTKKKKIPLKKKLLRLVLRSRSCILLETTVMEQR